MKARSLFLILAPAAAFLRSPVLAGEVQVTTHADNGSFGSLRWAIENAPSGDTITFAPALVGQTIILTSGELLIEKSLVILGPGPDKLAISGNAASRVFHVSSNIVVRISGLTITHGLLPFWEKGAGIYNDHSILTVSDCTISCNSARRRGGGGTYVDGGDFGSATLTVSRCTVSGNSTERGGGGLFSDGHDSGSATLTVSNCTVTGNSADFGGGIESWDS